MNYASHDGTQQVFSNTEKVPAWLSHIRLERFCKENNSNNEKRVLHFFSTDSEERETAIYLLKSAGKDACLSALPVLLDALRDQEEDVRVAAAEAIGLLEEAIPVEALASMLDDVSWNARAAAAQGLGNAKGNTVIKCLVARLAQEQDEVVREAIIRALGKQGDFMPISVLVKALRTDPNWLVREAAAWALGELGEVAPTQSLIEALQNDPDESVQAAAAKALGKARAPEGEEPLFQAFEYADEEVRIAAEWALQQFDAEIRGRRQRAVCHYDELPWARFKAPSTDTFITHAHIPPEEVFFALAQFISDKKGYVRPSDMDTNQGKVLLMDCFYQTTEDAPHETFLQSVHNGNIVEPIESALRSRDTIVQEAAKRALEVQKAREGKDVLLVSFALRQDGKEQTTENKPLQVVISGVGCQHVRATDTCVLDQIFDTWTQRIEKPLASEYPHDLANLKVWYHAPSHAFHEFAAL